VSETAATTQTLALRDGRRFGYAQWGAGDGDKDSASPLGHAQYVIDILPDAELTVVDGGGHFMIHTIIEDVISALAPHS
jgi:pimeloyl-ACP methyl ester carboxylesterase